MAGLILLVVIASQQCAVAAESAFGVGYRGEYSSNITRVPSGGEEEWANVLMLGMLFADFTSLWRARVSALAEHRDYRHDIVPDEDLYDIEAAAVWSLSPQRVTWSLEDRYTQLVRDTRDPVTPRNRVGANAASTGPDLYARLAPRQLLRFGARYTNVYFGETLDDYQRWSGYARWLYEPVPLTTWSLNLEYGKTDFDDETLNVNYRRFDAFLRWETRAGRSGYSLDLGTTQIERERGEDSDGSLVRLSGWRQLTSESAVGATIAREFLDTASALLASVTPAEAVVPERFGGGLTTEVASGDVYYLRRVEAFYRRAGTLIGLELRGFRRDYDYETLTIEDRRESGAEFDLVFFRSGILAPGLFVRRIKTEYDVTGRKDEDTTAGARLGYRATRRLTAALEASRAERASTDPGAEYRERRYSLTLFYAWGRLTVAPMR